MKFLPNVKSKLVLVLIIAFLGFGCQQKSANTVDTLKETPLTTTPDEIDFRPISRNQMLLRMQNEAFDVLIIGGGATGAGALLDASSRGLRAALIEANDFSSGTSSRSTKLVHGGVRYLENAVKRLDKKEYDLVSDALVERKRFLANAPHLSKPLPILTPVYSWFEAAYYLAGLKLYDFVAGKSSLGKSEFISKTEALKKFPHLKKEHLRGAVLYYDGQFDDARMNVSIILSAIKNGAAAANYVRAASLIKENNQVVGAMVLDRETNKLWPLKAQVVINACGPYADNIRKMDDASAQNIMTPSQGSHIVLPKKYSPPDAGLIIPKTKDGRVIFLLPWQGLTLAGTTDRAEKISENPQASVDEVEYILDHLRQYFALDISKREVLATFSGLRPLAKPAEKGSSTASISRDHLIEVSPAKLITIVGGKWTTYRKMGQDVIDEAVKVAALANTPASKTKDMPLLGGEYFKQKQSDKSWLGEELDPDIKDHLKSAYGDQAEQIVKNDASNERLVSGHPYIEAEVIHAVRHEYAQHVSDVLARRMRLAFVDQGQAKLALPRVLALMAQELSWSPERVNKERIEAEKFLSTMTTVL